MNPNPAALVVVAAGAGSRLGAGCRKALVPLAGEPLVVHGLRRLLRCEELGPLVVVGHASDRTALEQALKRLPGLPAGTRVVDGGKRRQDSVLRGLEALPADAPALVLVHDAARPFVPVEHVPALTAAAADAGCALLAWPVADTLKRAAPDRPDHVLRSLSREGLWAAQTPQACDRAALERLLRAAADAQRTFTDEAAAFEHAGCPVALVEGSRANFKITTMDDLRLAQAVLSTQTEGSRA